MNDFIKGFIEGFKEFGQDVAYVVNTILLTIVYVVGIGLTSLFRRKLLDMELREGTYWSDLNLKKKPMEEYYKQF